MTTKRPRYYVVWKGRRPGVYTTWEACKAQVDGYPDARYKAFPTREMAERAYRLGPEAARLPTWVLAEPGPQTPALAVDAAASQARGRVELQGVLLLPEGKVRPLFRETLAHATVPIGEYLAIVRALQWLHQRGKFLPVYTDSSTAWHWLQKGGPSPNTLRRLPPTTRRLVEEARSWLQAHPGPWDVRLWNTAHWGENPADFGNK